MCDRSIRDLIVIAGPPGVGKTTVANLVNWSGRYQIIESDAIWSNLYTEPDFSIEQSRSVFRWISNHVARSLLLGANIIVDGVFASQERIETMRTLAKQYNARLNVFVLVCDWLMAKKRIQARSVRTGRPLVDEDHWRFLRLELETWCHQSGSTVVDTTELTSVEASNILISLVQDLE